VVAPEIALKERTAFLPSLFLRYYHLVTWVLQGGIVAAGRARPAVIIINK
jgi:hypothetical protein